MAWAKTWQHMVNLGNSKEVGISGAQDWVQMAVIDVSSDAMCHPDGYRCHFEALNIILEVAEGLGGRVVM